LFGIAKKILVGKRGVITLPSDIRHEMGIDEGEMLQIIYSEGKITIEKIGSVENDIQK
jgi:AbrB family looped-hinge helix DNA binding protein